MYGYGYRYNSGLVVGAGGGAPFTNTYSLDFDGVDDYVSLGTISALNGGISAFSSSVWFKYNGTPSTSKYMLLSGGTGVTDRFYIQLIATDTIRYAMGGGFDDVNVGTLISGTWYNLITVQNGLDVDIYLNGVLKGSFTDQIPTSNFATNVKIANYISGSYWWDGLIDEVSLYDKVLSPSEIATVSTSPTVDLTSLSLVAWYRMGDNGAYKSPQFLLPNNENKDKVSNYSFEFDAVDDFVDVGSLSNLQNATEFSVSSWFKTPLAAVQGVWVWWDDADGWLELNCSADGSMIANVTRFNHTSATYGIAAAGTLTADTWYNATVVFDGSGATNADRLKLYVNGNLITLTFIGTIPTQTGTMLSSGLHIGERFNGQNYFNGNIDEVSIFDSAISIGDVWDGSGEPIDVSAVSGLANYYKMGEEATFSGGVWTVPDAVGSNDGTSNAMTIEDRVGDAPNSSNNALSYNMDLVDRVTDVP